MKLVGQHRSVWQESILPFPSLCVPFAGAWRVRFQVPRPGCNSPIGLAASDRKTGMGLRHLPLAFTGSGWFRRTACARTGPLAFRRLALAVALVGSARHRLRWRCSSRVRVWPFPPFGGERERSQTLNFTGGNRSRLTPNPLLKSVSVASRLPFGRTKPEAERGTMSHSPVSTRTAMHGGGRRASVATTCWCWRKWPIRPARASSSFSRKNSRRRSPSVRQASESGGAGTRRSPNLHK